MNLIMMLTAKTAQAMSDWSGCWVNSELYTQECVQAPNIARLAPNPEFTVSKKRKKLVARFSLEGTWVQWVPVYTEVHAIS